MKRRTFVTLLLIGLFSVYSLVQMGCAKSQEPVKIGLDLFSGLEPFLLASEKGLFQKEGVTVNISRKAELFNSIQEFQSRNLDITTMTLYDAIKLASVEIPLQIPMLIDYSNGANGIVARGEIKTVKDLRGKRLGVTTNTLSQQLLFQALESNGLKIADIELVDLEVVKIKDAFIKGEIDAGVLWQPYLTTALKEGKGHIIYDSSQIPKQIVDVLVVAPDFLAKRKDAVKGIIKAWFGALDYLKSNSQDAFSIMARQENILPEEFQRIVQGIIFTGKEENLEAFGAKGIEGSIYKTFDDLVDFMVKRDIIDRKPSANRVFYPNIIKELAQR